MHERLQDPVGSVLTHTELVVLEETESAPIEASTFNVTGFDVYTNTLCNAGRRDKSGGPATLCAHCFLTTSQLRNPHMMSLDTCGAILDWATTAESPIEEVTFLGGEFALHPNAAEMLKLAHQRGLSPRIVTNGSTQFQTMLEDPEVVDILNDPEKHSLIAISLESIYEDINDIVRGKGAWRLAQAAMKRCCELDIPFRINTTILQTTNYHLSSLFALAEKAGAIGVNVHYFSAVGRGSEHEWLIGAAGPELTFTEWRGVLKVVKNYRPQREDFTVDCELAYADMAFPGVKLGSCAVRESTNLQFGPPPNADTNDCPVTACGLLMDQPETSGYIFRGGQLFRRPGHTELTLAEATQTVACPLPGRADKTCIYQRLERP